MQDKEDLRSIDGATTLVDLLQKAARRFPDRVGLVRGRTTLTYAEIDAKTSRIACRLAAFGVEPEEKIGLFANSSIELVLAILGILKAGAAYLPLDPGNPVERLRQIVANARPRFILTEPYLPRRIHDEDTARKPAYILIGDLLSEIATQAQKPFAGTILPDQLAYVIYTSGSTGVPKGSLISHKNVVRLFGETQGSFEFSEHDVWVMLHSFAFDFSVWEIFGALLFGGKLVIPEASETRDPALLVELLARHKVSVLNQTPSFFYRLALHLEQLGAVERRELSLELIIFGGERLDFVQLRRWQAMMEGKKAPTLINMYGITETTVHVTAQPISAEDIMREEASVIGKPLPDLEVHLLDKDLQPVARGAIGEMFVSGAGLARGYHQSPALTAEQFLPCPFGRSGQRMYRTGDLGRVDGEGRLAYVARKGGYVKVRGFRVSLGEIESAIRKCAAIRNVAALAREEPSGILLDAYVQLDDAGVPSLASLRWELGQFLPHFMIPHHFHRVESIPLTLNGKVDAGRLRQTSQPLLDLRSSSETTPGEARMLSIWRRVLGAGNVEATTDFFAAGGDSIRAVELVMVLMTEGYLVTVEELLRWPNVRDLAYHHERTGAGPAEVAMRGQEVGASVSDMQQIMLDQYVRHASARNGVYHVQQSFTIDDPDLDLAFLHRSIEAHCARHECFRFAFEPISHGFCRFPAAAPRLETKAVDLSLHSAAAQAEMLAAHATADLRRPFDESDSASALIRITLFQLSARTVRLCLSAHHAIDDGWGQQQLFARILASYQERALPQGEASGEAFDSYVTLQRKQQEDPDAIKFWDNYAFAETSLVSADRSIPPVIGEHQETLAPGIVAEVLQMARSTKAQLKALVLAVILEAVAAVTGEALVTVGLVVNGRTADLPASLYAPGLYWNLQPFSWQNARQATSEVELIHEQLNQQSRYSLFPLTGILDRVGARREFMFTFNFTNFPAIIRAGGVSTYDWQGLDNFHYPVNIGLHIDQQTDKHGVRVTYDPVLFTPVQATWLLETITRNFSRMIERVQAGTC